MDPSALTSSEALQKSLFAALKDNPYFEAGFGLSLLGAGMAVLRSGSTSMVTLAKRHLLVTMEVTSKDLAYPWVLGWLTKQASQRQTLGMLGRMGSTMSQHVSVNTSLVGLNNTVSGGSTSDVTFDFAPCPGRHIVTYNGSLLVVERTRSEQAMMDMNTGLPFETVRLTSFGRSRDIFEELLRDASRSALEGERHHTTIYKNWGSEWHPFGKPRLRRPLNSVILDETIAEGMLTDIQKFMASKQWYIDRGIPYRRGYLLHGPPGSGKTSFITALAGELGFDICVLNLSEAGLTDDRLALGLSNMPPRSFALLEDVDAAFRHRDANDHSQNRSYVTFSGLLNALDGVAAGEERVVFMTTNHLTRLDPALIRPGRADILQCIDDASDSQMVRMFLKFYPGENESAQNFATAMTGVKVSMAMLQGFFMTHREEGPIGALANTHLLRNEAEQLTELQRLIAEQDQPQK